MVSNPRSRTICCLTRSGCWRGAVLISYRGGRSRKLYASGGSRSANSLRLSVAAIPKTNWMSPAVPAIEVGALSEFGIAPQEDLLEASPATEANRLVEVEFGLLLRGPVAAAVDQVKRLSGVGQRDQQRMITPGAVVGDVDALLALGVGLDEGAIA